MKTRDAILLGFSMITLGAPGSAVAQPNPDLIVSTVDASVVIGETFQSAMIFDNVGPDTVDGWTLNVCHDPALLDLLDLEMGSTTLTINGGSPPEFLMLIDTPPDAEGAHCGVIISFLGLNPLPPGNGYEIAVMTYLVEATTPVVTTLEYCDGVLGAAAAYFNIVSTNGGTSNVPVDEDGTITITEAPTFVRGDTNGDGVINIADPISNLLYQFQNGSATCLEANDTNGDGQVNVSDPIYNLYYINGQIPPPPAPFPDCGPNPGGSVLGCASHGVCP